MERRLVVAIDFDGTIAEYHGWQGEGIFGKPVKGVREGLKRLKEMGYIILIYTSRREVAEIERWLQKHDIPYDYINKSPWIEVERGQKIPTDIYIDDRAVPFRGDWNETLGEVERFKVWWQEEVKN